MPTTLLLFVLGFGHFSARPGNFYLFCLNVFFYRWDDIHLS